MKTEEADSLRETIRKRVGGSLTRLHPLDRLEVLRRNARALTGEEWKSRDDGTVIRKIVGKTR